jgi:cytidine deaminase
MEDHRSQDRRQKKKKKVEIYTYRTATGSAIETAAPRLIITATGSAIKNAEANSAGELKCIIVVSDSARTDYLN